MLIFIITVIVVPIIVLSFVPENKWPQPKKKRRRRHSSSSDSPKTLPWFDVELYEKNRKSKGKKHY